MFGCVDTLSTRTKLTIMTACAGNAPLWKCWHMQVCVEVQFWGYMWWTKHMGISFLGSESGSHKLCLALFYLFCWIMCLPRLPQSSPHIWCTLCVCACHSSPGSGQWLPLFLKGILKSFTIKSHKGLKFLMLEPRWLGVHRGYRVSKQVALGG